MIYRTYNHNIRFIEPQIGEKPSNGTWGSIYDIYFHIVETVMQACICLHSPSIISLPMEQTLGVAIQLRRILRIEAVRLFIKNDNERCCFDEI